VYGIPNKPQDLKDHKLVTFGEDIRLPFAEVNWILKAGAGAQDDRKAAFKVNSLVGILRAVESGIGIAGLPDYMMQSMPQVSKVLPELKGPVTDVYLIYSLELRNSKRIKVFRDFIVRKLSEDGLV
jgi:DNA-binding transcriptional LysR family regulator